MLRRAVDILREDGLRHLIRQSTRFVYENGVRIYLPRNTVTYNGVKVRAGRFLDPFVPGHSLDKSGYEEAIVAAIRKHANRGDHVVIVGGGWGVSAVAAAKQVGDGGHVRVYEGAKEGVKHVRETTELNDCSDPVTVKHAIIGREVSLYSEAGDAAVHAGSELPACDLLVLDCEGAENDILEALEVRPSTIVVETHGFLGTPEEMVRERLDEAGYVVRQSTVAESANAPYCEEHGIYVLVATPKFEQEPA